MNRINQLLFVLSLFIVANNDNVVQSLEAASSTSSNSEDVVSSSTTTTATTKQQSSFSNIRSLWNIWTSTTSSSTSSSVRSSTNLQQQQEQQPVEEELPKCQLCHDGSYPKRANHGVGTYHSVVYVCVCETNDDIVSFCFLRLFIIVFCSLVGTQWYHFMPFLSPVLVVTYITNY
jgi:hypothetical protein